MSFINMDTTSVFIVTVYFISFIFTFRHLCLDLCQKVGIRAYPTESKIPVFMNN